MMGLFEESKLRSLLPIGGLGEPLLYFLSTGSTNDVAAKAAQDGAPHGTLVIAESQTEGRGRKGNAWMMMPGMGIAFSLVFRPTDLDIAQNFRMSALGSLAVVEAMMAYSLSPKIKWPNDVLLRGKKVGGVLVEANWKGEVLDYIVLGIGVNFLSGCVPPSTELDFPTISIMDLASLTIDPHHLLMQILSRIGFWFPNLDSCDFWQVCERNFAYLGRKVVVDSEEGCIMGRLLKINEDGSLTLLIAAERLIRIGFGFTSLRPVIYSKSS